MAILPGAAGELAEWGPLGLVTLEEQQAGDPETFSVCGEHGPFLGVWFTQGRAGPGSFRDHGSTFSPKTAGLGLGSGKCHFTLTMALGQAGLSSQAWDKSRLGTSQAKDSP